MNIKITIVFIILCLASVASAQTTEFTYQGSLRDGANPANGNYDFEFLLFDAASGGAQVGLGQTRSNVAVANGVFAVTLNFGLGFSGANRFLEIRVRPTGGAGFTPLDPRQRVASSPYAIKSINADNATTATTATNATSATNALQLGGVAAGQYVLTGDARLSDARAPTAGSTNYVQNTTSPQAASNFNISGNGTAGGTLSGNIVNTATQFNIGNERVLSAAGTGNLFAGVNSGANTTGTSNSFFGRDSGQFNATGFQNSFFGRSAGQSNTSGNSNSFFGLSAGQANSTGNDNSFFGTSAGQNNTTASGNSFFGRSAGLLNTIGLDNSFFGRSAGQANITGNNNSFVGRAAGQANTTGINNSFSGRSAGLSNTEGGDNSFFGSFAGESSTTGGSNTFIGRSAGNANTTGSNNTIVGRGANVGSGNLTFATAIGAGAVISGSNEIQMGRTDGSDRVIVSGNLLTQQALIVNGTIVITDLQGSGITDLCRNLFSQVATCSSSLRYKSDVQTFSSGLNVVSRLRPITFNWNESGERDLGFGAEEVEKIEPLLASYNDKGEIEGVKYKQITTVLVNAIKEQQTQIEAQNELIKKQQAELEALKMFLCSQNPAATICTGAERKP